MERRAWCQAILIHVFVRLRSRGMDLGFDELLAAFRAVDGGMGKTVVELRDIMTLLWCHGPYDEQVLAAALAMLVPSPLEDVPDAQYQEQELDPRLPPPAESLRLRESQQALRPRAIEGFDWELIPVQPPPLDPIDGLHPSEWPISRRFMAYAWRRLSRPTPSPGEDEVDIAATVERVARWGFFLEPVYRQGQSSRSHLLLLIDQNGSMVPFHRFSRDLIETAQQELGSEQVEVGYFYNVPTELYSDPYLSQPRSLNTLLETCSRNTSIMVVSDAGAARRSYSPVRIRTTQQFLERARWHTRLVSWLNPMPEDRWQATSAHMISSAVSMFPMEPWGFTGAIDAARGRLSHYVW